MPETLHIHNARIWTGDSARPWARSITINQGQIQALDMPLDERHPAPPVTRIDAGGRVVTPGLIDAHIHLLMGGTSLTQLSLSHVRSREEFEAAIALRHNALLADEWLIAVGWSQENWVGNELPSKEWLAAAGDRPVVCYRMDLHVALVNEAVLRLCDLQHDPPGGCIVRDSITDEPTGMMIEAAAWQLVNPLVPEPDLAGRRKILRAAQHYGHAMGLTAVGSMEYAQDVNDVYVPMRHDLTLRCRITLLDRDWPMNFSVGCDFANDDRLAVIGYKTFIDGTLGSRTARMLQDYADDSGNRGLLVELTRDGHLHDWIRAVAEHGLSPSMHAIGDEAARLALNAIDAIGPGVRPRIEHAQQLDPADILRFAGRIASMQPLHKADDCRFVRNRVGDARLAGTFAFRKLINAGAILAFGSDWPVVSPDPILGIRAAVTGLLLNDEAFGIEENLTVEESLHAYTKGAAYALGMDNAGVLRVGNVGDAVMFDRDPFTSDWAQSPPRVTMTVAGGTVVYDACAKAKDDPTLL